MAETLALAVGVPAVLAAACLASRRSWSPAYADNRGIALQTVIVIVVMLVIAGGVAGVLLSRASEVQSDLEAVETGVAPETSFELCESTGQTLLGSTAAAATGTAFAANATRYDAAAPACRVQGLAGAFSETQCESRDGTWSTATGGLPQCLFN